MNATTRTPERKLDTPTAVREITSALGDAHGLLMLATHDPGRELGRRIEEGHEGAAVRAAVRLLKDVGELLAAYEPEEGAEDAGYTFDKLPESLGREALPGCWRSIPVDLVSACVLRARSPLEIVLLDGVAVDCEGPSLSCTIWGSEAWIEYALVALEGVRCDADGAAPSLVKAA